MNKKLGIDWLKANDPSYVSPQKKSVRTRTQAYTNEAIEKMTGNGCYHRSNGKRYALYSNVGFSGIEGKFHAEAVVGAEQEAKVLKVEFGRAQSRRRGRRAGRKHR